MLVFGVAELARLGAPLGPLEVLALVLLSAAVVAAGLLGYILL